MLKVLELIFSKKKKLKSDWFSVIFLLLGSSQCSVKQMGAVHLSFSLSR